MRLNIAIPEEHVSKEVLDAALETNTRLNESLLKNREVPSFVDAAHQVRWKPEPPGGEYFDHAARVLRRGWGDCDDLAPWHAASLRVSGVDRGAFAEVVRSGPTRWHAVVRRSDGQVEDPSIAAGMRSRSGGRSNIVLPSMAQLSGVGVDGEIYETPLVAVRPILSVDGEEVLWEARTDLPWHHAESDFGHDVAMSSLRQAPLANQSIVGSLHGATWAAEHSGLVHPGVMDRADAIADAFDDWTFEDLVDEYGEEEALAVAHVVGDIWGTIADVASKVISFVPGIGPMASLAIDLGKKGVEAISAASRQPEPPPPEVLDQARQYAKHRARGGAKAKKVRLHRPRKPAVLASTPEMRFSFRAAS